MGYAYSLKAHPPALWSCCVLTVGEWLGLWRCPIQDESEAGPILQHWAPYQTVMPVFSGRSLGEFSGWAGWSRWKEKPPYQHAWGAWVVLCSHLPSWLLCVAVTVMWMGVFERKGEGRFSKLSFPSFSGLSGKFAQKLFLLLGYCWFQEVEGTRNPSLGTNFVLWEHCCLYV